MSKSTPAQIRERFDNDVERFSNLETGQSATIDAPLVLDLITQAAATVTPHATHLLDIGCGAGNYTLKMLGARPNLHVTLVDLSAPMLQRATERVRPATSGTLTRHQADIRDLPLGVGQFDIILAAAVFHHLRSEDEWEAVFAKCFHALRPGGSLWISDLVEHTTLAVQTLMRTRYGEYLVQLRDEAYREHVFAYIEQEDTPRPLVFQMDLLRKVGFDTVELLHKNSIFAAFGGIKNKVS
ncbi:MAG: class I SAM-dependent methyltransferase [Anaerolineales bacterium]|nr:class I SAM-dependent methyltransferase [Anaerolineales bacterium]